MNNKLNNLELFAGAGGLIDGFEQTGKYNLIAAVEWQLPQVRVLKNRLSKKYNIIDADKRVLHFDIQRTEELLNGWNDDKDFGSNKGLNYLVSDTRVDIISGGPPCQAYSLAGRIRDENGMKEDYRNFLFEAYLRIVASYKPKLVVFENVEGILSAIPTGEKIIDLIKKEFNKVGYEIIDDLRKHALLDLSEFGVPQKRKRVIIIGIRKDKDVDYQNVLEYFYDYLLSNQKEAIKTVYEAISDLPKILPVENPTRSNAYTNDSSINGHKSRFHSERDKEIFRLLAEDLQTENPKYTNTETLKELYYQVTGKRTNVHKYHVLRWDKPSNTIPAHLKKDGLRHIHPDPAQCRTITVREAARLQSFDDDFEFTESQMANFEMIGNAVPPLFAKKVADIIPKFIEYIKEKEEN